MDGDTKRLEEAPLRTLRRCDGASENGGGGGGGRRAACARAEERVLWLRDNPRSGGLGPSGPLPLHG
jgi:hypothetical protein